MKVRRLIEASEAVGWLSEQAGTPGEEGEHRLQMALILTMAHSYLAEYCAHVTRGMEPYDALLATARGESPLSKSQRDLIRAVVPRNQIKDSDKA